MVDSLRRRRSVRAPPPEALREARANRPEPLSPAMPPSAGPRGAASRPVEDRLRRCRRARRRQPGPRRRRRPSRKRATGRVGSLPTRLAAPCAAWSSPARLAWLTCCRLDLKSSSPSCAWPSDPRGAPLPGGLASSACDAAAMDHRDGEGLTLGGATHLPPLWLHPALDCLARDVPCGGGPTTGRGLMPPRGRSKSRGWRGAIVAGAGSQRAVASNRWPPVSSRVPVASATANLHPASNDADP